MGVTGLWDVVKPCARPVKIETLNRKRLAVDASIWIYQFLKAVRDKEGNALRNSHIVGFFQRICKLLFNGVKPVFVFDGGAPILKRQTISARKGRREGRREDAIRTAGKMLAVQMARRAEEEEQRRKEQHDRPAEPEDIIPENVVYAEEIGMSRQERQQARKFKKKDQYHLPDLDMSLAEMGAPNDPRIMSVEELEQYARQFEQGEDISVYDFSKIDFDSTFFMSLPDADRYNILNAARLRSRLRMGHSKEQLDQMFPDRMAFSKFQIERVKERNELTQRLMNINGMNEAGMAGVNGNSRIAGERGREYVLIKNDGVEGGWALGVVSSKEERNKPIDVDELDKPVVLDEDDSSDDGFEDVPIEGLNRLPKQKQWPTGQPSTNNRDVLAKDLAKKRAALYDSRKQSRPKPRKSKATAATPTEDENTLFVREDSDNDEEWEDVAGNDIRDPGEEDLPSYNEEEELERAIAMSLGQGHTERQDKGTDDENDFQEVFRQSRVEEARPFGRGSARAIASMANARSSKAVAEPAIASDDEDDVLDMQAALAEARRPKQKQTQEIPEATSRPAAAKENPDNAAAQKFPGFDGPLPFEKLDLGSSLLGKKKMQKLQEEQMGGFEKDDGLQAKKKGGAPVPPWFQGDLEDDMSAQKASESEERRREKAAMDGYEFLPKTTLRRETTDVIDLDAPDASAQQPIAIDSSDDEEEQDTTAPRKVMVQDSEIRVGDLADKVRVEPPDGMDDAPRASGPFVESPDEESSVERTDSKKQHSSQVPLDTVPPQVTKEVLEEGSEDEPLDWGASDTEAEKAEVALPKKAAFVAETSKPDTAKDSEEQLAEERSPSPDFEDVPMADFGGNSTQKVTKSPSAEFEDVPMQDPNSPVFILEEEDFPHPSGVQVAGGPIPASGLVDQEGIIDLDEDGDLYSDPEDEELFRQLAQETEEHARFAATFNNKTQAENARDYENELKQLRNQQKKDRRDADEVTQTMVQECQQLLALFGLPYITAPMEAEAQCAELVHLNLVDGIVTDDSDIFLFGGNRVYKNLFNQAKVVECYLNPDIMGELGLDRQKLIAIAQLLGSDYTEGLSGVGPVTAVELLSEFGSLTVFREWWTEVQAGHIPVSDEAVAFRKKFRRSHANKLFLPSSFPDPRVEAAYLHPEVDNDPSAFVWGVPDLDALRNFLMSTIGWTRERTDEVLVPVIKVMNSRDEGTQANITNFFEGGVGAGAFAPRRRAEGSSKRMVSALSRMKHKTRGDTQAEDANGEAMADAANSNAESNSLTSAAAAAKQNKVNGRSKRANPVSTTESDADEDEYTEPKKKARKNAITRRRAALTDNF